MIKVHAINKANATAEIELPLDALLPQYQYNKKSPLKRILENPQTLRHIKRLEAVGDANALAQYIQKKIGLLNDG